MSIFRKFLQLHYPIQIWLIMHPFTSYKAFKISTSASLTAIEMAKDTDLDGDYAGGQVDAFRHGFWMARLTQKIGGRRAKSLGKAYEKCNEIDYRKGLLEDSFLPDYVSSIMDLKNNDVGINFGKLNKKANEKELINIIKNAVLDGEFFKIKKNEKGQFLTKEDSIIKESDYLGRWYTRKTIVRSNY